MPNPMQVVTISVTETSIILASSLAVANSAIFIVLFEATFCDVSSAALSLCACLLSLLFFTEDFLPLCNFANVSRTLFCASSGEISIVSFLTVFGFLNFLGSTFSLTILTLFFFSIFSGFLNLVKSIFWPVVVTPLSFPAVALINSESSFFVCWLFSFEVTSNFPTIFGVFFTSSFFISCLVFSSASSLAFSSASSLAFSSASCCIIISSAFANSLSFANNSADNFAFFSESNSPSKSIYIS